MKRVLTIFILSIIGISANPQVALADSAKNLQAEPMPDTADMIRLNDVENDQLRSERKLKEAELEFRDLLIGAVSGSLIITGILAVILFRQRKQILRANKDLQIKNEEISFQKNAIESQAEALLILNDELLDLNKTLAGRIDERTKQISHQDKKLAEYTFMNSHKLRAPLASILGLINLFQHARPAEQEIILNYLKTCGEQLDNTVRAINHNLENSIVESNGSAASNR